MRWLPPSPQSPELEKIDAKYSDISKWDARQHVPGSQRRCFKTGFVSSLSTSRISKSCRSEWERSLLPRALIMCVLYGLSLATREEMEEDFPPFANQDHSRGKQKSMRFEGKGQSLILCWKYWEQEGIRRLEPPAAGMAKRDKSSQGIATVHSWLLARAWVSYCLRDGTHRSKTSWSHFLILLKRRWPKRAVTLVEEVWSWMVWVREESEVRRGIAHI